MKGLVSFKHSSSRVPSTITEDSKSLTNPTDMADEFNHYFSNLATGIQSSLKHSRNRLFDFFQQIDIDSFFIIPADKTAIKNFFLLIFYKLLVQIVSQQKS